MVRPSATASWPCLVSVAAVMACLLLVKMTLYSIPFQAMIRSGIVINRWPSLGSTVAMLGKAALSVVLEKVVDNLVFFE